MTVSSGWPRQSRQLQARTNGRPALYRVVEVAPWHPAPEMRAMQVPFDASGAGGMKPLSLPSPVDGTARGRMANRQRCNWGSGGSGYPASKTCGASTCGGCPSP